MARRITGPDERGRLSTLEFTVLGLTWLRGPCTIYAIMKDLYLSASSFHRSRAGTAYSVAKRLLQFGLIVRCDDDSVTITPEGEKELRQWLSPPVPFADVAHSADLLRLRFFFLGAVDHETRLAFIDNCIAELRIFREQCDDLLPQNEALGETFGVLATASTLLETDARIRWLMLVRKFVAEPIPDGHSWTETIRRALSQVGKA